MSKIIINVKFPVFDNQKNILVVANGEHFVFSEYFSAFVLDPIIT